MSPRRPTVGAVVAAGTALAAAAGVIVASNPSSSDVMVIVAVVSVALPYGVAVSLLIRYPDRRLGWLLVAIGTAYFLRSLGSLDNPIAYSLGRALGQFGEPLLVWLMLAFPRGRLPDRTSRVLVAMAMLSIVLLWWPVILFSEQIPISGAFAQCGAGGCPSNAVQISDAASLSSVLTFLFRATAIGLLIATALVLARRLLSSTLLMRILLGPVLLASLLRLAAVVGFLAFGSPSSVAGGLVLTYWAIPLAIQIGLARGRAYDAAALQRLVRGLQSRPGSERLREVLANALGDPTLEVAYWLPARQAYATVAGEPVLVNQHESSGRAVTEVGDRHGDPIAALIHDPAFLDHPELLEAIAATARIGLESVRMEAELATSKGGIIAAVDTERRRIERDLHDGAQQRLIALRMKLSAAEQVLGRDIGRSRELIVELGGDVEAALEEVRSLGHGVAPPLLQESGPVGALRSLARTSPLPVTVEAVGVGRYSEPVESAIYFCCVEALQNASKHAREASHVEIRLTADDCNVHFTIADDGCGFTAAETREPGLSSLRARASSAGGEVEVESTPEVGTRVVGTIPH